MPKSISSGKTYVHVYIQICVGIEHQEEEDHALGAVGRTDIPEPDIDVYV